MGDDYSPSASELKTFYFNALAARQPKDPIHTAAISESFMKDRIVYYRLRVTTVSGTEFLIRKRYRHFQDLQRQLGKLMHTDKLPALPKKQMKVWVDHTTREFVAERQFQMNNYIQDLISLSNCEHLTNELRNSLQVALEEFFTAHRLSEKDPTMTEDELTQIHQKTLTQRHIAESFKSFLKSSKPTQLFHLRPRGTTDRLPNSNANSTESSVYEDEDIIDAGSRSRAETDFVRTGTQSKILREEKQIHTQIESKEKECPQENGAPTQDSTTKPVDLSQLS